MKASLATLPASMLLLLACGVTPTLKSETKEPWDPANDPLHLGPEFNRNANALPKEASLPSGKLPWSDTYWPTREGGIAARWRDTVESGFDYELRTKEQVAALSLKEREKLSPAEKYDIYMGRFDYPLVKGERWRTSPESPSWFGLCHGWAIAALLYPEPKPVVLKGPSGIEVPFGSSDVKALLTYFQGEIASSRTYFLGARCEADGSNPDDMRRPECRDTNAGSFHVVIANQIGVKKEGFVIDKNRGQEVWNHPVFAFKTTYGDSQPPSPGAAPNAVKETSVRTRVKYASEIGPMWEPVLGTDFQYDATVEYEYRIEIDANGNIVGGEWDVEDRPDFMWRQDKTRFTGYYSQLETIVKAAGQ